jgi:hypothetical protein
MASATGPRRSAVLCRLPVGNTVCSGTVGSDLAIAPVAKFYWAVIRTAFKGGTRGDNTPKLGAPSHSLRLMRTVMSACGLIWTLSKIKLSI